MDCKVKLKVKGNRSDIERFFTLFWSESKNRFSMLKFVSEKNMFNQTGTLYDIYKCNKNLYNVINELEKSTKEESVIKLEYCSYVDPNIPFIKSISKKFNLKFEVVFYQNEIEFIGTTFINNGKIIKEWLLNSTSENYYDFLVKLEFETVHSVLNNFDLTEEQKNIMLINNSAKNVVDIKNLLGDDD